MTLSLGAVLEEIAGKELKITLAIDNQSTIAIAKPSGSTSWRTRHLRVRAAFIREQVQEQKVVVKYVKGQQQFADLLTKSFPKQRLEELVSLWGMGRLCEGAKSTMLIAMVVCMMVQTARAQEPGDESLAINTSLELYIMIVVVGIAMAGLWEFVWLWVDRCCMSPQESRSARRLRRLRESVRQEIEAQIGGYDEPATPLESSTSATTSTRGRISTGSPQRDPTPRIPSPARMPTATATTTSSSSWEAPRPPTAEASTQTSVDFPPQPFICYQDREVPVPVPDPNGWNYPIYVSPHGDTFHTYERCWGLRNTRPRSLRYCQCCRDNHGKSLKDRG